MESERLLDGRLKLRHLTLVTAIADQGSVIRAAQELHITQPVVTRALHELETILGVPLFERHHRGVTPTLYGESFVGHARAVLAQLRQAGAELGHLAAGHLGSVTVGVHLAGSNLLLPRAMAALKRAHPAVTVVVREATPDTLRAGVLSGEIDLIVGRLSGQPPRRLTQEQLYREPVRLTARTDHPVHQLRHPSLAELRRYPWVLPVDRTALRAELEELFTHADLELPDDRVECTSMPTLRHFLLATDALAVLPLLLATQDPDLRLIDTPLKSISQAVGLTRPADRPLSPAADTLRTYLRQEARGLARLVE
ncbi:LysR substrate-binding domain-containing protein [Streptomyces sp. NPDC014733]|uniref:LysR substrate-binding domain-containing protein n=1 Tax=Streptomyces sp. NPDC014733 TaxID=3364885 RepID=UPI0036F6471D